ncbi:ScyD/ScyE family protein [Jatrophihabitans telluris]|uniref:ScyD/ScyE family protein n=1 Tax=Jatrophihabitans telluris TaxID=2038343 RepID=A0ABY4QYD3_9ACTN|nr:ScyD/ScyE family protein [Jatrophihabitans telluris]UQX88579.1 ScyD/ScyE family protein [Jatrophihabitans telluris]
MNKYLTLLASTASAALVAGLVAAPASGQTRIAHPKAAPPPIKLVAGGLSGPLSISFSPTGRLYASEAAVGDVTRINLNGSKKTVASGIQGLAGISAGLRYVYAVQGFVPETGGTQPGKAPLLKIDKRGHVTEVADLFQYELAHNPDGQAQGDPSDPNADSISNPFAVLAQPHRVLVADGGANDVLSVDGKGQVSTFFAPRNINEGVCAGAPNNDPQHPGCDPVPTGLAVGPHGDIYVSGLGAEAPGAARVWRLDGRTGQVKQVWKDLTDATGVAVGPDGTIYVSELFYGVDVSDPNADPTKAGRIVRIARDGHRTYAPVRLPGGLAMHHGKLYATQFSVLDLFLGSTGSGQIVTVSPKAFVAGATG